MNKKSILLILLSTLAMGANAQGKYTIKGNLQNAEGQKIYLYSGDMGNMDIDSTIIANGKFTLNGELDTPFKCGNLILGNPKDYLNANLGKLHRNLLPSQLQVMRTSRKL